MAGHFLDTSALVKHYHPEKGTDEVDRLWNDPGHELFTSRLSTLEIVSAFAGKVRAGVLTVAGFENLRRRFSADLSKKKRPISVRILVLHYQQADRLLRQYGPTERLRTLDALQLAVALDLRNRGEISQFACSDQILLSVAGREGLATFDPENP
jgi:predicted nucleic acid-binding protein